MIFESKCLPESYCGVVRCHDRVELHGSVLLLFGPGERVLAERAADSAPPRIGGDHEAGGGECEPGPGRFGPIFAVPSTRDPSYATTV